MEKFAVNYNTLECGLKTKAQAFRYEDVKHRLKKVAFDVVKFKDADDISGLWQIQRTQEGDVIVAKYDDNYTVAEEVTSTEKVASHWSVISDRSGENIHVFYKNNPVTKIALASVGIPKEDADIICECLPDKLATNEVLASNMLRELPDVSYKDLLRVCPELRALADLSLSTESGCECNGGLASTSSPECSACLTNKGHTSCPEDCVKKSNTE